MVLKRRMLRLVLVVGDASCLGCRVSKFRMLKWWEYLGLTWSTGKIRTERHLPVEAGPNRNETSLRSQLLSTSAQ
jgi:hypothetical protein